MICRTARAPVRRRRDIRRGGRRAAPETDDDVVAYFFDGDVVLRVPLSLGSGGNWWFPYLVGGAGVGIYDFDETVSEETSSRFAVNVGGGVEVRLGRVGFYGEFRDFISDFEAEDLTTLPAARAGETQHDLSAVGGITFSF